MAITFSRDELTLLREGIAVLTSPLAYPTTDHWRAAVNRTLLPLVRADSAGFLLPIADGIAMFSEEHDQEALSRFPELLPPPRADGVPIWDSMLGLGVCTLTQGYAGEIDRYERSAYYNEYAAPNHACETLVSVFRLGGAGPAGAASLHFWHGRRDPGRAFGDREVEILRLLDPAFHAGVGAVRRHGARRGRIIPMLDSTGGAALVLDRAGRVLHRTSALTSRLALDPEHELVLRAMRACGRDALSRDALVAAAVARDVRTAGGGYRISATVHPEPSLPGETLVVVALHPQAHAGAAPASTLTPTEARVATLMADGLGDKAIASAMDISWHTARRHAERVLQKLGVRSRREVRGALGDSPAG